MNRFIKRVSLFLVVCLLNAIFPLPVLAVDVNQAIQQLTPVQKEQAKNLSPQDKEKIKSLLGGDASSQPNKEPSSPAPVNKQKDALEGTKGPETAVEPSEEKTEGGISDSEIEKGFVRAGVSQKPTRPIRQFGYEVFSRAVGKNFSLIPSIPIGPDYRINPGDSLLVTLWGNINEAFTIDVDARGSVTFPKVGIITVAGMSVKEAREVMYERLAKVFITDFNIDLTVKEIGSIKIYLVGEFNNPGAYTVLANTSVYDAIFTGGGPTKNGSLRKIELVRNGVTIKTLDLYKFVLSGNRQGDILLESGDVVRAPAIGDTIAVTGNVKRPAIYEMKSRTELSEFMALVGITPTTYTQRIQIERKKDNRFETALDINYAEYVKAKGARPLYLQNLDYITVFSIEPDIRNVVYLEGNVVRPGRYELKPGMRLMDLFVKAEGLASGTYMERAQIFRLPVSDTTQPVALVIDLNKMKSGDPQNNPLLKENDRVRVFSEKELKGQPMVYISGEINDGDKSLVLSKGMRVSDLIFAAGGVKESADLNRAELCRTPASGEQVFYNLDLKKILKDKDASQDLLLQKNDYLFVRSIPDYGVNAVVEASGEVSYPGKYVIHKGERLSSLISRAGGFTGDAFLDGAVFVRKAIVSKEAESERRFLEKLDLERGLALAQIPYDLPSGEAVVRRAQIENNYTLNADKVKMEFPGRIIVALKDLKPGNNNDLILQAGDTLTIPERVDAVTVMGEVYSPGTILYASGKSIDDYLNFCGGATEFADRDKILLLHASGKVEKIGWQVRVNAGDTIVVPEKPLALTRYQKPFDWNEFWDTSLKSTTVLAQTATALVTVYLLYKTATK